MNEVTNLRIILYVLSILEWIRNCIGIGGIIHDRIETGLGLSLDAGSSGGLQAQIMGHHTGSLPGQAGYP